MRKNKKNRTCVHHILSVPESKAFQEKKQTSCKHKHLLSGAPSSEHLSTFINSSSNDLPRRGLCKADSSDVEDQRTGDRLQGALKPIR